MIALAAMTLALLQLPPAPAAGPSVVLIHGLGRTKLSMAWLGRQAAHFLEHGLFQRPPP